MCNIDQLRAEWIAAKTAENEARNFRLKVEQEIIAALGDELPDTGTTKTHGLKIVTGYNRKWDQAALQEMVNKGIPPKLFPFKTEYKEIKRNSDYLANNEPEIWEYIARALTLTPKKPAISIIED